MQLRRSQLSLRSLLATALLLVVIPGAFRCMWQERDRTRTDPSQSQPPASFPSLPSSVRSVGASPRRRDERMRQQCAVFGIWHRAPPAAEGRPCHLVETSAPQALFTLPNHNDSELSKLEFQPLAQTADEAARRQASGTSGDDSIMLRSLVDTDLYLLGSGKLPSMSEYLSLLSAVRPTVHMVQIGANAAGDGELNEWVRPVLMEHPSWTATVIEPVPSLYDLLVRNYESMSHRVEPMRFAVASRSGPCTMHVAAGARGGEGGARARSPAPAREPRVTLRRRRLPDAADGRRLQQLAQQLPEQLPEQLPQQLAQEQSEPVQQPQQQQQRDEARQEALMEPLPGSSLGLHGIEPGVEQVSTLALGAEAQGTRCFSKGRPCAYVRRLLDSGALVPIEVRCITLHALLQRRRDPSVPVDVLVIDAEMLDYTLLRSIDLRAVAPLAIEFESKTLTMQQGHEIAAVLAVQGYLCRFAPSGRKQWPGKAWWRHYGGLSAESVCFRVV